MRDPRMRFTAKENQSLLITYGRRALPETQASREPMPLVEPRASRGTPCVVGTHASREPKRLAETHASRGNPCVAGTHASWEPMRRGIVKGISDPLAVSALSLWLSLHYSDPVAVCANPVAVSALPLWLSLRYPCGCLCTDPAAVSALR